MALSFSVVFRNGLPRAFKHLERSWIKAVWLIHTGRCSHFASVALNPPAPRTAAGPDGCLLELDYFPVAKCVYGVCAFVCWGDFPVLTLYSPRSIVWGLFFFSSLSSCYAVIFFNSLSSCPVYPLVIYVCYVWAGWWLISLVLVTKWQ